MMQRLLAIVASRIFVSFVGVTALAALLWFVGPLVIIQFENRQILIWTIVVFYVAWLGYVLFRGIQKYRANKEMAASLAEAEADPTRELSEEEIVELSSRFEEALGVLKKTRGKKGRLNLYDLPWYVIIGPPGSGKTTALNNSGLDFPLADRFGREALRGVGGTRNCDWWFTNEAILLDTAGRYTTQDSHAEVDKAAWDGFLGLLKKYRKRRPINGVIVAISISDLMLLDAEQRREHAFAIKRRVQELNEFFGIQFPVYVLITKMDLVTGFMEFFDDMDAEERCQVWGTTFQLPENEGEDAGSAIEDFGKRFDELIQRLNGRLLWRVNSERDARRRGLTYGFPSQLASLKELLDTFLGEAFAASRYEKPPLVRGVYFTSGTQEGAPIDRLMAGLAQTFGLEPQATRDQTAGGRSYFITNLLKRVVFAESELAGTNRKLERQRAWLQGGAYVAAAGVAFLMITLWTISYFNNRGIVDRVSNRVEDVAAADAQVPSLSGDWREILPVLNVARTIPTGYSDQVEGAPLFATFGLYQGRKLGSQTVALYERMLQSYMLPRVMQRLEEAMGNSANSNAQFAALKAYLMFENPDRYDPEYVTAWMELDWENNLPADVTAGERAELGDHLAAMLEIPLEKLRPRVDSTRVSMARADIGRTPLAQRVYGLMQISAEARKADPFKLGPEASSVFVRRSGRTFADGIPGMFTRPWWENEYTKTAGRLVSRISSDSWVLGGAGGAVGAVDAAKLEAELRELYLDDYGDRYEDLVADVDMAPFPSVQQAASMLGLLSDPVGSPLKMLLESVVYQTKLGEPVPAIVQQATGNEEEIDEKKSEISELTGAPAARPGMVRSTGNPVAARFRPYRQLVEAGGPAPPAIEALLAKLYDLFRFMNAASTERILTPQLAAQGNALFNEIKLMAQRQPPLLENVLSSAATSGQAIVTGGLTDFLNQQWQAEPLRFCRQAIENRYPVAPGSGQEVRLDDFARFFGPGGLMDEFFNTYLLDKVDMTVSPWRLRAGGPRDLRVSNESIRQFERARIIRDVFFRSGTGPAVSFDMIPTGMDAAVTEFLVDLQGQRMTYSHGPQIPVPLKWPGADQTGQVRLEIRPPSASGRSMIAESGPWAWFRVLDQAQMQAMDVPERFEVTLSIDNRWARYEMIARSVYNPFRLAALKEFRCPARL